MSGRHTAKRKFSVPELFSPLLTKRTIDVSAASKFYRLYCDSAAEVFADEVSRAGDCYTCSERLFHILLAELEFAALDHGHALLASAGLWFGEGVKPADLAASALYVAVEKLAQPRPMPMPADPAPQSPTGNELPRSYVATLSEPKSMEFILSHTPLTVRPSRLRIEIRGKAAAALILAMEQAEYRMRSRAPLDRPAKADPQLRAVADEVIERIVKETRIAVGLTNVREGRPFGSGRVALYLRLHHDNTWSEVAARLCRADHRRHTQACAKNFRNQAKAYERHIREKLEAVKSRSMNTPVTINFRS